MRTPLGVRTAIGFTIARRLTVVLGEGQAWNRLAEPVLRALSEPLGVSSVTVDPQLTAPAPSTARHASPAAWCGCVHQPRRRDVPGPGLASEWLHRRPAGPGRSSRPTARTPSPVSRARWSRAPRRPVRPVREQAVAAATVSTPSVQASLIVESMSREIVASGASRWRVCG
ncbi:SAV_915 family protein [Streptomyces sp. LN500]|uniref:SAV_915 family protein n=1 Tax=Streptomyces sp. LN500 TaxID=3112978 RepID=UPI003714A0E8